MELNLEPLHPDFLLGKLKFGVHYLLICMFHFLKYNSRGPDVIGSYYDLGQSSTATIGDGTTEKRVLVLRNSGEDSPGVQLPRRQEPPVHERPGRDDQGTSSGSTLEAPGPQDADPRVRGRLEVRGGDARRLGSSGGGNEEETLKELDDPTAASDKLRVVRAAPPLTREEQLDILAHATRDRFQRVVAAIRIEFDPPGEGDNLKEQ